MKKGIDNGIDYRRWKSISIILILIFSISSSLIVSAEEDATYFQNSSYLSFNSKIILKDDRNNQENSFPGFHSKAAKDIDIETPGKLRQIIEPSIKAQEDIVTPENTQNNLEQETENEANFNEIYKENSAPTEYNQIKIEETTETKPEEEQKHPIIDIEKPLDNLEDKETSISGNKEHTEAKQNIENKIESQEKVNKLENSKKSAEASLQEKTEITPPINNHRTSDTPEKSQNDVENKVEQKIQESNIENKQKSKEILNEEENIKTTSEEKQNTKEKIVENLKNEPKASKEITITNKIDTKNSLEETPADNKKSDHQKILNNQIKQENKQESNDIKNNKKSTSLNLKTSPNKEICSSVQVKFEKKEPVKCLFTPEIKICNKNKSVTHKLRVCNSSLENNQTKTFNWTYLPVSEELNSENSTKERNNWNIIKLILSYPRSSDSFYTTHETIKFDYKGSEPFEKVNIYIVKERPSILQNNTAEPLTFEDIVNENTESYIQIPATLKEEGKLPIMSFGPLPAGNYWILVTNAQKGIYSASYFKVLEYEISASSPLTLKEGENLEVNLALKNVPSQENYTYWAALINEAAYKEKMNTTEIDPCLKGIDSIENLKAANPGKDLLQKEIQKMIGEGNGTVSIGEQGNLSLTALDLPAGNYLLFTGAYEDNKGLIGLAQKEISIYAVKSSV